MPRTAKQIDFSQGSGPAGGSGDDIVPFEVEHWIIREDNGYNEDGTVKYKYNAGVGEEGLCNEPMFDTYREGSVPGAYENATEAFENRCEARSL